MVFPFSYVNDIIAFLTGILTLLFLRSIEALNTSKATVYFFLSLHDILLVLFLGCSYTDDTYNNNY